MWVRPGLYPLGAHILELGEKVVEDTEGKTNVYDTYLSDILIGTTWGNLAQGEMLLMTEI